jgi:hypothetical protein
MEIRDGIGIGTGGFFSGMLRGVSNPREGSKILTFLYRPRLECSSWKVNSMNFARTEFSEVRRFLGAVTCFVL